MCVLGCVLTDFGVHAVGPIDTDTGERAVDSSWAQEYADDAACFAYTCRRLIHLSLIAGFRQPTRARAGDRCAQCGC